MKKWGKERKRGRKKRKEASFVISFPSFRREFHLHHLIESFRCPYFLHAENENTRTYPSFDIHLLIDLNTSVRLLHGYSLHHQIANICPFVQSFPRLPHAWLPSTKYAPEVTRKIKRGNSTGSSTWRSAVTLPRGYTDHSVHGINRMRRMVTKSHFDHSAFTTIAPKGGLSKERRAGVVRPISVERKRYFEFHAHHDICCLKKISSNFQLSSDNAGTIVNRTLVRTHKNY